MKELIRLVVVLTLVSLAAGVLLAVTQKYTAEPIRQAKQRELFDALGQVLPPADGDPVAVALPEPGGAVTNTFYVVRKDGALAGIAFVCVSPNGYAGPVEALVGLKADGTLHGLRIKQNETPGLGSKVSLPAFLQPLLGKPLEGTWKVTKDGGTVDAVSGATISSRAVCDALTRGQTLYRDNRTALEAAAAGLKGQP